MHCSLLEGNSASELIHMALFTLRSEKYSELIHGRKGEAN
jgi:hypothetical protein